MVGAGLGLLALLVMVGKLNPWTGRCARSATACSSGALQAPLTPHIPPAPPHLHPPHQHQTGVRLLRCRFLTLLNPTYAKNFIPIISSVSEHQPTTWASYIFDLHLLVFAGACPRLASALAALLGRAPWCQECVPGLLRA